MIRFSASFFAMSAASLFMACGNGGSGTETAPSERTEAADDAGAATADGGPTTGDAASTNTDTPGTEAAAASAVTNAAPAASDDPQDCPPREQWPEGMACVAGGEFTLGFSEGEPDEGEPGRVELDAFYMDLHEITNAEYRRCVEARQCKRAMPYRQFGDDQQPVVAVSWADAAAYCEMVGKRLPTEAEWERAASGPEHTQYPWGDESGGCEKANITDRRGHGCGDDVTLPVGSKAAGHWGLFDLAGNVHEWVADWYSPCLRGCEGECGDACFGRNPRGPCAGAEKCPGRTKRSIRGGSWYWPEERARTTARRGADPVNSANHRFGFRCAKSIAGDRPRLAGAPTSEAAADEAGGAEKAAHASATSERLPFTPKQRRMLDDLRSEDLAFPDEHYFHSNEWRHDLLADRLRDLGGAYIGVGADQNYTMASLAGSELLLLVDFDPRIPRLHRILEVLVEASDTPDELLGHFAEDAADESAALLAQKLRDLDDGEAHVKQYKRFRERWGGYLGRVRRLKRDGQPFGWLAEQDRYDEIRRLFREDRIIARAGDVTGEITLREMGHALRRLDMPAQVVYFSNAEQFFPYSASFIKNIESLPTTERSVVVRTTRHKQLKNADGDTWHYVLHDLEDFRTRLKTGAYPRAKVLLSDLLRAGPNFLGKNGVSILTSEVPRRVKAGD